MFIKPFISHSRRAALDQQVATPKSILRDLGDALPAIDSPCVTPGRENP
ncbi:MAG: hypothetical protein PHU03_01985 [Syntrophales bacterium]|nr:hypothetical protein [Syntrophales bacterium]